MPSLALLVLLSALEATGNTGYRSYTVWRRDASKFLDGWLRLCQCCLSFYESPLYILVSSVVVASAPVALTTNLAVVVLAISAVILGVNADMVKLWAVHFSPLGQKNSY